MPTDTTTTPRRDARGRFAPAPQARYAAIRARLDATRRRVLTWDAQRELLHPHDAAEDADWPAPMNYSEARDLLRRLPIRVRVMCAYIAAEMALPIWEQRDGRFHVVDADGPRAALELVRRWLDGEPVSAPELREATAAVDAAAYAVANAAAYVYSAANGAYGAANAAYSAANAVANAVANGGAYAAANAAYAAYAAANAAANAADATARYKFYILWWARCRSRLAIADIETAELEAA